MTETQILNQILDQIRTTGPIASEAKAKMLAKRLAPKLQDKSPDPVVIKDPPLLKDDENVDSRRTFARDLGRRDHNAGD